MMPKKRIFAISGSASQNSTNVAIVKRIAELGKADFELKIMDSLTELPHFKTELTDRNVPGKIVDFRNEIVEADGIIICTPEYIYSIPSGLKNAIEWCVSTTVFSDKPIGIITASASGKKGHHELKLIMETLQTKFTDGTTLLVQGVKGKIARNGNVLDAGTDIQLKKFVKSFNSLVSNLSQN